MSATEMRLAVEDAGFSLSSPLHQIIVARDSEPDRSIDFHNFVACVIRLEILFCELVCLITTVVQTSSPRVSHAKKHTENRTFSLRLPQPPSRPWTKSPAGKVQLKPLEWLQLSMVL
ncbi:unnamed protein product [Lota lota]